jgi:hypothetical protein
VLVGVGTRVTVAGRIVSGDGISFLNTTPPGPVTEASVTVVLNVIRIRESGRKLRSPFAGFDESRSGPTLATSARWDVGTLWYMLCCSVDVENENSSPGQRDPSAASARLLTTTT